MQRAGIARKVFGLWLLSCMTAVQGAENEQTNEQNGNLPDLEFLEFLGQFETDEGEWIDPGSLLADEFIDFLNAAVIDDPDNDDDNDVQPRND